MSAIIVYSGKYGATQQYADWLGEILNLPCVVSDDIDGINLTKYDTVLLGSSVYMGKIRIGGWLKSNLSSLNTKTLFLFIVCGTPANEKEKLDQIAMENIPEEIRNRCSVHFLPGRMIREKLSKMDRFLLKAGMFFTKDPAQRKRMGQDFDSVRRENLDPIIRAFRANEIKKKSAPIVKGAA